jgi:uncharacterized protein (UPF0335 family)
MLTLFRKIRQNLLSERKIGKYLKYAIGEIVLVVIGILIALSINNWNEERKAADYTKLLFKKTLEELEFNIEKANSKVADFRNQNSAYYIIINKKETRQNFKTHGLAYLLFSGNEVELSDNTFQKLLSSHEKLTQEQDDLLSKLKIVYNNYKGEVDYLDTKIVDFIFDLHKKYKDEQSWYPYFISYSAISDDMVDYFLNDPEYINDASYFYSLGIAQQNNSVKKFRDNAIIAYTEISKHLNITPDTAIVKDLTNYRHYLGAYKRDNLTLYIKEEAKGLIQTVIPDEDTDNSTTVKNSTLYLDSKSHFTDSRYFGRLIYDEDNKVTKIEYTRGGQKYNFEKIN